MTALTLATSLLVHGHILSGSRVVFYLPWIFKFPLPEVWRFFTSFWVTGGGLSILFDTYFCEPTHHFFFANFHAHELSSMDLLERSRERVWPILATGRLFHLRYIPRPYHPSTFGYPRSFSLSPRVTFPTFMRCSFLAYLQAHLTLSARPAFI